MLLTNPGGTGVVKETSDEEEGRSKMMMMGVINSTVHHLLNDCVLNSHLPNTHPEYAF